MLAIAALAGAPAFAEACALIVGINDYREITLLQKAVGDAEALKVTLETSVSILCSTPTEESSIAPSQSSKARADDPAPNTAFGWEQRAQGSRDCSPRFRLRLHKKCAGEAAVVHSKCDQLAIARLAPGRAVVKSRAVLTCRLASVNTWLPGGGR
jgi:hypothetical protein